MSREISVEVGDGQYAALDFGGDGVDVLLVPQLASNAALFTPYGEALSRFCHPVAIDLAGHGRTTVPTDDPSRIAGDLAKIVTELGLQNPLIVMQEDEVLALSPDRLASVPHRGLVLLGMATFRRGEEARAEWTETMGPDSIEQWRERIGLFASGTADTRGTYLEDVLAKAAHGWTGGSVDPSFMRTYYERHIVDGPDGWNRLPAREWVMAALDIVAVGPHGLDLADTYDGPLWIITTRGDVDATAESLLTGYAAEREDRHHNRVDPGHALLGMSARHTASTIQAILDGTLPPGARAV